MSRTATIAFILALLAAISSPALAQIGIRTAKPPTPAEGTPIGDTMKMRIMAVPAAVPADDQTCEVNTGWFPIQNAKGEQTRCFWNQDKKQEEYLKYGRFVGTSKTISATTEIMSDAFGAVRVALSTAVATPTEDDDDEGEEAEDEDEPTSEQDEALNLLSANGGNLALTASYPIYFRPVLGGSFLWNSYLRLATNVSALGSNTETTMDWEDVSGNVELAFTEMQLDLLSYEKRFNLLGYLKTSAIFSSDKFAETLHADASRNFFHGQIGAGMRIGGILSIFATYNWYSDKDIPGEGGTVTFSMTRSVDSQP